MRLNFILNSSKFVPLFLILIEAYKYPGFWGKHFGVPLYLILFFFLLVYLILSKNESGSKLFLLLSITFLITGIIGIYLNLLKYPNFFYSIFHLDPKVLISGGIYLFAFYIADLLKKLKFKKAIFSTITMVYGNILLYQFGKYFFSNFELNIFDGAISLLGHYYANYLTPYKDFGFPYPPLRIIILGQLIPFKSPFQRNLLFSLLLLFLFILLFALSRNLFKKISYDKKTIFLILFLTLFILELSQIPYEPFFMPFFYLYLLLTILYLLRPKRLFLFLLGIVPLFLWLSNWHFSFFLLTYEFIFWTGAFLISKKKTILTLLKSKLLGNIIGAFSLILYLAYYNAFSEGFIFLYKIHKVAMPYRKLPLSQPSRIFDPNTSFYIALFTLSLFSIFLFKTKKLNLLASFLISSTLIFLPYALGRSDWPHFLPILKATMFSTGLLVLIGLLPVDLAILSTILFSIPFFSLISFPIHKTFPTEKNRLQKHINQLISDCKQKTSSLKYNSIFLTKDDYTDYTGTNNVALYLVNPRVRPATPFLHDEINVQSSCYFGGKIVKYLTTAPKPILTFVEKVDKLNKKEIHLPSCNKIEKWLSDSKFTYIGTCTSDGKEYEIRIYK